MTAVWIAAALSLAAHASNSVAVGLGAAAAPFRDEQVSPLKQTGTGPVVGLSVDVLDAPRIDRTELSHLYFERDGWTSRDITGRWTWAPPVADLGWGTVHLGVDTELGLTLRTWRDAIAWHGEATVGPAAALRVPVASGGVWTSETTVSTAVLGFLGRPGYAAPLQSKDLSTEDVAFASLHNHRAGRLTTSVLWRPRGPQGSALRLQLDAEGRGTPWRHPLREARYGATLYAFVWLGKPEES